MIERVTTEYDTARGGLSRVRVRVSIRPATVSSLVLCFGGKKSAVPVSRVSCIRGNMPRWFHGASSPVDVDQGTGLSFEGELLGWEREGPGWPLGY